MRKYLISKILALSVIFLFIGVSFSSAISVDTHSIVDKEVEEDCGCEEKNNNRPLCDLLYSRYLYNLEIVSYYANLTDSSHLIREKIYYFTIGLTHFFICLLILNIWGVLGCDKILQ